MLYLNSVFFFTIFALSASIEGGKGSGKGGRKFLKDRSLFDGTSTTNLGPVGKRVTVHKANSNADNKLYMSFAGAAYCFRHKNILHNPKCSFCKELPPGYEYYTTIKNTPHDTLALVAVNRDQNVVIVAFRGRLDVKKQMKNSTLVSVDDGNSSIMVHTRFRADTWSLYNDVLKTLENLTSNYNYTKVIIAGHSLGGVEASLTTYFLISQSALPSIKLELYTYGQPRVGNRAWADYMNSLDIVVSRVVNKLDAVPHFLRAALGYYHHQNEFWIKSDSSAHYCNTAYYEDPDCAWSNDLPPNLHDSDNYYGIHLQECMPSTQNNHL